MRSTEDGAYWWAQVPVEQLNAGSYHGARYQYVLDGDPNQRVQDPATGWVEGSALQGHSRLVQRQQFQWQDQGWQTPSWDWLRLYQLHPARFSRRGPAGATPLDRVAWEIEDPAGYLRQLRVNALQLMPINEVGTTNSWGYDPAFFYAVEASYGGPDALKRLVNTCHRHSIAVLLDVVFNHAGTSDNSLWPLARGTFFDGDTTWGAMINFDHPQVIHFFEQNLVYLLEEYHVDGFRFDFTRVIIHGDNAKEAFVRQPGSGGGWNFLHKLRAAARSVNPRCILIAEHLPNEWWVTNFGGPMDSQWYDEFHDRLEDACAGNPWVMSALANALKLTHTAADDWYEAANYAESHDEVGNQNGRIANVAGWGRGLRMAKVAAAVTLMSRGVPMLFMGGESGEHRQFFKGSSEPLDLEAYLADAARGRIREWFNALLELRWSENIRGPSPLAVAYAEDQQLAFVRGQSGEYFTLVNFGGWSGWKSLAELNLPDGVYRELWNSTWPAFAVENEDEHTNGGRDAHLHRGNWLQIPDYGAVILERR
jgi:1,4-alpha-glucan branching enzyme